MEVVDLGNRNFVSAHSKKGATKPKPLKIPRPPRPRRKGEEAPVDEEETVPGKKRPATPEELRAFFGGNVHYTGPQAPPDAPEPPPRCAAGHFVRAGQACRRCAP